MLSTLNWNEGHLEQSWTLCDDIVRDILSRRSTDADLKSAVAGVFHVNCFQT